MSDVQMSRFASCLAPAIGLVFSAIALTTQASAEPEPSTTTPAVTLPASATNTPDAGVGATTNSSPSAGPPEKSEAPNGNGTSLPPLDVAPPSVPSAAPPLGARQSGDEGLQGPVTSEPEQERQATGSERLCRQMTITREQLAQAKQQISSVRIDVSHADAEKHDVAIAGDCAGVSVVKDNGETDTNFVPQPVNNHCLIQLSDHLERQRIFNVVLGNQVTLEIRVDDSPPVCFLVGPKLGNWFGLLHIENDLGISDQNYTDGERLEIGKVVSSVGCLDVLTFGTASKIVAGHIGLSIYTPTDISWPAIIPDERPYAGWLYAGVQLASQRWEDDEELVNRWRSTIRWELSLGALGDPGAGAIQRWFHYIKPVNSANPIGWQKGLHVETLPALYVSAKWLESMFRFSRYFDISSMAQLELGNVFTRAHLGGMVRLGYYRDGDGPGAPIPAALETPDEHKEDPSANAQVIELFAFSRASTALVVWNGMLQGGNFFSRAGSPHTVEPRRIVPQTEIGAQFTHSRFFINASHLWRGPEVDTLHGDPFGHRYSQVQVGFMP